MSVFSEQYVSYLHYSLSQLGKHLTSDACFVQNSKIWGGGDHSVVVHDPCPEWHVSTMMTEWSEFWTNIHGAQPINLDTWCRSLNFSSVPFRRINQTSVSPLSWPFTDRPPQAVKITWEYGELLGDDKRLLCLYGAECLMRVGCTCEVGPVCTDNCTNCGREERLNQPTAPALAHNLKVQL